jgi:hypothetical protein
MADAASDAGRMIPRYQRRTEGVDEAIFGSVPERLPTPVGRKPCCSCFSGSCAAVKSRCAAWSAGKT